MNKVSTQNSENIMGVLPENELLLSVSIPIMLSLLIQALYNLIDSIFVANFSDDAFTAVSLTFPIQMLMISVGIGTGIGINALLSKSLGENDLKLPAKLQMLVFFFLLQVHYYSRVLDCYFQRSSLLHKLMF